MKFRKNIIGKGNSVGTALFDMRDELFSAKSVAELSDMVDSEFEARGINTPKSRMISFKLKKMRSLDDAFIYIQNIIFSASGMATY